METNSSSRESIKCWVCPDGIALFFNEICGRTFALCPNCKLEFDDMREQTEYDFNRRWQRRLVQWLEEQRTVKRFDKTQHKLFKRSENEET